MVSMGVELGQGFGVGLAHRSGLGEDTARYWPRGRIDRRLGVPVVWFWVTIWAFPQVGDFAILLRAGFDRWTAAKLQFSTALGGLLGACFAICTQSPKGVGMRAAVVSRGTAARGTAALLQLG